MESIFGPVPLNPVTVEPPIINDNWPTFNFISDVNFSVNSPFNADMLFSVNIKPMAVIKLFCDHPNLTWVHVKNIPLRPLTSINKGPKYAVTRTFANSFQADVVFRQYSSPSFFNYQVVTSCMGNINERAVVHLRSHGNRRRRFFRFIEQGNENSVCLFFISK